jgi:replicative DNA helicase
MSKFVHPGAERTTAAAILAANEQSVELLKEVGPTDFSNVPLQIVVESCKRLLAGIEPVDTQAVLTEAKLVMKEWKVSAPVTEAFLNELWQTDTRRALPYAKTVKRYAWLRNAEQFSSWFTQELGSLPDPEDLFTAAQKQLDWLKPPTDNSRFVYGWDTVDYDATLAQRLAEKQAGTQIKFDYPWWIWNQLLNPLRKGMVGLLGGAEGSGKSSYLEMIAEHWATKCHVVFVHFENDWEFTRDRRMARHAKIAIDRLEDGELTPEELDRVKRARVEIASFAPQLHYFETSGMSMGEVVNELRRRHAEGVCDAVVLDYLNKVKASRGQVRQFVNSSDDRRADDMDQLKTFCEQKGVVAITAAQYNKEGKKGEGRKRSWDIRGSGELADKAQWVVLLDREVLEEDQYDKKGNLTAKAGEDSPLVKVRVDKQNRGKKGDFEQVYKGEYYLVAKLEKNQEEVPDPELDMLF